MGLQWGFAVGTIPEVRSAAGDGGHRSACPTGWWPTRGTCCAPSYRPAGPQGCQDAAGLTRSERQPVDAPEHKPPFLAVWGKNDPFFLPAGAEAFTRDIPDADVRFFDTGHFALETHCADIAAAMRDFLTRIVRPFPRRATRGS